MMLCDWVGFVCDLGSGDRGTSLNEVGKGYMSNCVLIAIFFFNEVNLFWKYLWGLGLMFEMWMLTWLASTLIGLSLLCS